MLYQFKKQEGLMVYLLLKFVNETLKSVLAFMGFLPFLDGYMPHVPEI